MNRRERRRKAKEARGTGKGDKAVSHGIRGEQLAGEGKIDEAIEAFRRAISIDPQFAAAHHNLGVLLRRQGLLNEAIESYTRATAIQPDYVDAHYNLGNALLDIGNLDAAVASYHKALAIKPDFAQAHNNLGNTFKELGRLEDAIHSHRKAVAVKPDYVEAHYNLGVALHDLGKVNEAVESYNKALDIKPDFAEAHINLGTTLEKLGHLDEAIAGYHKALAIKPNFAEAHYNLGNVHLKLGHLDEAFASHQKALTINPEYAEAYNSLGATLKELGRLDEAIAGYHKALAIKPNFAEAHYNLGIALKELGQLDESVASYHKAIAIQPGYAEAWNNLRFSTKALQFSKVGGDRAGEVGANGLNDAARATVSYAIHQFYFDGFRPHEADESFEKIIAALPPTAEQTIPINGAGRGETGGSRLPDKVVALLHFGRSGSGLLHSLIDGHPEISTLPSIYLRGYFSEGVWDKISTNGWRELPDRFADEFAVLFDAQSPQPIPSRLGEKAFSIGKDEGMTCVGENRDETLSLDRDAFRSEALRLIEDRETIDPMSFLLIVHAAFETVMGTKTNKHLCFYHIHNPDHFAKPNFLRYAPDARLLMTVREPIQNCESSIHFSFKENNYNKTAERILAMLFDIDQVVFRMRESVGVRLEDLKTRPEATMKSLCAWLGVKETPSLYEMTAQGKKWWGDPSSPEYDKAGTMSPFGDASIKRPVGAVFSKKDQFVLETLFHPFSVRFGYREPDPGQFSKDLKEVRPLIDDMLDFEKTMADRSKIDHASFKRNGAYQLFRAGLVDRWDVLDELEDYPHILQPLSIA